MRKRTGKLTKAEKDFIRLHVGDKPTDDIARELDRPPEMIRAFVETDEQFQGAATTTDPGQITETLIRQDLRSSRAWKAITDEFDREELRFFEETYVKWMTQFKGDVLPSEETQIFQAAKFEILMSRELKEQRRLRDEKIRVEQEADELLKSYGGAELEDDDRARLSDMERRLDTFRTLETAHAGNYLKLQDGHADLMKSLKGTRDQRIKEIEKGTVNFLDVIKQLNSREARERSGRQIGLLALAGKRAAENLGNPIVYGDGVEDRPILNHETVGGALPQKEEDDDVD